jgi:chitin disaccharide deacetylase
VTRVLIVNADDFGRSHRINLGIVRAHDHGIVTSASAMVCWPAAEEAADLAGERPALAVGLHFDLGEWQLVDGSWRAVYERVPQEADAVEAELETQMQRFRALFGRAPTHLDSHQHVHRKEPARMVLLRAGHELGVPVREVSGGIVYRGDFHGRSRMGDPLPEAIRPASLLRVLSSLAPGVTELSCHPGAEVEHDSRYAEERPRELEVLCDPRFRAALTTGGIALRSFADL